MAVEGSLDLFRLPEILQVISQEGKTGILTVRGERDIVAISFSHGRVVAADALNRTLEDGLGETLAGEGLLDRERYAEALAAQQGSGGRLIDVLVDRGFLERSELLAGLRRHTSYLLLEVLRWDDGEFKFYANDEVSFEEGFDPIVVETFLLHHLDDVSIGGAAPVATPASAEPETPPEDTSPLTAEEQAEDLWGSAEDDFSPLVPPPPAIPSVAEHEFDDPFPSLDADPFDSDLGTSLMAPENEPELVEKGTGPVAAAPPQAEPADEQPARAPRPVRDLAPVVGRGLGIAAVLVVLAAVWWAPLAVLVPMPWDADVRTDLGRSYEVVRVRRIEGALHAHGLAEGRLPDRLEPLVEAGDLSRAALVSPLSPGRRPAAYRSEGLDYSLAFRQDPAAVHQRTFIGDFLLDPESLGGVRRDGPPLVLLD